MNSVQSLSRVQLFVTPWTAAPQASLSITNSWSLLKLMLVMIESVMPSNHLILCCSLLLPPSIFPSIRVFSNELVLHIKWPKYWSFSFNISPSNERYVPESLIALHKYKRLNVATSHLPFSPPKVKISSTGDWLGLNNHSVVRGLLFGIWDSIPGFSQMVKW